MENRTNPPAVKGVTAAILVTAFLYAFVNSISSVLLNEVVAAFSLTGAAQGLLSSMLSVGYMLALLVNPLFQGRTEKLFMLLLSGLLQVAMLLLSGSASSFAVFLTAIVLLGVGCGWLDGYINSCMIDFHPHDSPKYLSLLHGLFGVGSLLAPLLMQALLLGISWRGVFFAIAAMTAGAMLCVALARRGAKGLDSRQQAREERLSLQQFGGYLRKKRNLLLLACGAMCAVVQTGLTCWIVRYMLLVHNNDALGATCLTVYWVAATVNRFLAPHLRVRPLLLILGGGALSAGLLALGILSGSAAVMCLCFGLLGLVTGHFMPMMVAECARGYQGSTTLTTSMYMFVTGIARVVVPILMADLSDAVSIQVGMSVPIFAGLLVILFAAGALRLPAPDEP